MGFWFFFSSVSYSQNQSAHMHIVPNEIHQISKYSVCTHPSMVYWLTTKLTWYLSMWKTAYKEKIDAIRCKRLMQINSHLSLFELFKKGTILYITIPNQNATFAVSVKNYFKCTNRMWIGNNSLNIQTTLIITELLSLHNLCHELQPWPKVEIKSMSSLHL